MGMESPLIHRLKTRFPTAQFQEHEKLSNHTYFKIGGPAEVFIVVRETQLLADLVSLCVKEHIHFIIFGGGSNVLVTDDLIPGLVIKNLTQGVRIEKTPDGGSIFVESGVPTNVLVRRAIDEGLAGLEYFLGVPGSVGGAVYNNSHYMNQLIGEHIESIDVIEAKTGEKKTMKNVELQYKYDYSILQETHDIVLSAKFVLKTGNKEELEQRAREATTKRANTQPLGIPSSGCMFQNAIMPDGKMVSAGYLIDQAGLKGTRVGDAMVSDKHASFIVNVGSATAKQVDELAELVKNTVKDKFGVVLKREVFSLG
ncbi:MAG TPA: hypothetical protein DCX25_01580 [Candidatus Pacebacteria bacterium]|nr:MAG: UDP-N-acetylenolpyruvoylglucosamine reductase [Microgenomates group bacterium GW2011_GWB1_45_17]KKU23283.1 MAG: UDP-N-acetylenolpyruvoylglucosamine reductase [Microgenomates group bacterium GW2011_GWA1_46_15]KKU23452.1 MAG: UDP-N-acetylenolpyruvoylglucosamine reductase [Microgenomates group bacterium GW2011_GWC1_46_15]HAV14996.1 hypothetical protein [Candidatus Paceibacterota bacterium]HCR11588.1 hypothetical protein [Candidatus Paceibacterota bacterium]